MSIKMHQNFIDESIMETRRRNFYSQFNLFLFRTGMVLVNSCLWCCMLNSLGESGGPMHIFYFLQIYPPKLWWLNFHWYWIVLFCETWFPIMLLNSIFGNTGDHWGPSPPSWKACFCTSLPTWGCDEEDNWRVNVPRCRTWSSQVSYLKLHIWNNWFSYGDNLS